MKQARLPVFTPAITTPTLSLKQTRPQPIWAANLKDKKLKDVFLDETAFALTNSAQFIRLREILNQNKEYLLRTRTIDYDNPSWSHKQAHINGKLDQIEQLLTLIGNHKEPTHD